MTVELLFTIYEELYLTKIKMKEGELRRVLKAQETAVLELKERRELYLKHKVDVTLLLQINSGMDGRKFAIKILKSTLVEDAKEIETLNFHTKTFIQLKILEARLTKEIKNIRDNMVSKATFGSIMYYYNKLCLYLLVTKNIPWHLGVGLGKVKIYMWKKSTWLDSTGKATKYINWVASNLRKQEIIDNGGVPYSKKNAPDGEFWFVLDMTPTIPIFVWDKGSYAVTRDMKLKYGGGTRGSIATMRNYHNNNPEVEEYYPPLNF